MNWVKVEDGLPEERESGFDVLVRIHVTIFLGKGDPLNEEYDRYDVTGFSPRLAKRNEYPWGTGGPNQVITHWCYITEPEEK